LIELQLEKNEISNKIMTIRKYMNLKHMGKK